MPFDAAQFTRSNAEKCFARAEVSSDARMKERWLAVARTWQKLGEMAETQKTPSMQAGATATEGYARLATPPFLQLAR
jgi:hypothetical protein